MATNPEAIASWSMRWNARMAFSATVHLVHSGLILLLTLFVPGAAGSYLRCAWGVGAFFSAMGLILVLRIGSYEGTSDEEVGQLIRQGYWVATGIYLCLLVLSLYLIVRAR